MTGASAIRVGAGGLGPRLRRRRPTLTGIALLAPCLILLAVFFYIPLFGVLVRSLTDPEPGVGNYVAVFTSKAFSNILYSTFEVSILTTLGCLFLGFPLAYWLTTLERGRARVLLVLCTAPLWVAILARLYAWTVILGRHGVINESLIGLGLIDERLDLLFNREAVLLGMVHVMLPFMILILYSSISGIDRSLLEAADSLGARPRQTLVRIFLPLVSPGVAAGCLLVLIMSLGFFILPAVLGGGGDITIPIYVQSQIRVFKWGVASAMSIVLLVVTLVLFAILGRLLDPERLVVGGSRR